MPFYFYCLHKIISFPESYKSRQQILNAGVKAVKNYHYKKVILQNYEQLIKNMTEKH